MKRIVIHVAMARIAGSEQELELVGDEIPDGWDRMTDEEKEEAVAPIVQNFIDNEVNAGWGEYGD